MIDTLANGSAKTFVFDLDGVVYLDKAAIPGAGEALTALRNAGHQILFATNNSARAVETVIGNIAQRTGFVPDPGSVITSGLAAANLLMGDGETCLVLGSDELAGTLSGAGIELTAEPSNATAVVVGLDLGLSYERLTRAVVAIGGGARFIATNDDPTYPMPNARYPGAGSIVAAVERATGETPIVCGKPYEPMRRLVEERIEHLDVWMVGDRPDTDLAFAAGAGWGKILVLSGVTDDHRAVPPNLEPDHAIDTIADLPRLVTPERVENRG
ncbi:MAG: HAD-IIA family hydrolase [Actinomycetota bacterium]|nr:HAD-IIA family hydrolase [Actinomycetota bacterium]